MKRTLVGIITVIVVTLGLAAWTSKPVSAQHAPIHQGESWHVKLHEHLMSMIPDSVHQKFMEMHGKHAKH